MKNSIINEDEQGLKMSIPGKLPSSSLLLLLSFSPDLLLLCPEPKSTRRRISSAIFDVSSLYPLFPSFSFFAGFFYLLLFQLTSLTKKKKKCSLSIGFPFPNKETRLTSSMTPKNQLKKIRVSSAHNSLKTSYPENLL